MQIVCWNVRSLLNKKKLKNFLQIIEDRKIDFACINETWFDSLKGPLSIYFKEFGYLMYHSVREDQRGGGVAIIYKDKLMVKPGRCSCSEYSSFEFVFVTCEHHHQRSTTLINIYRNQEISMNIFVQEYTLFLEKIFEKCDTLIVVGDFNAWAEDCTNSDFRKLNTLMNSFGLNQMVREATHEDGHTLDHLYINEFQTNLLIEKVTSERFGLFTDHYPVFFQIPVVAEKNNQTNYLYRKLKDVDIDLFRKDLAESLKGIEGTSFEAKYLKFNDISRKVIDKHAPLLKKEVKKSNLPWIDGEFRQERAKRRKLEKCWSKNRTAANRNLYIDQKNRCSVLYEKKRKEYYSGLISEAGNCQKSLFKVANTLLDKNAQPVLPCHTDSQKLANEFNDYYIDKVKQIRNSIPAEEDNDKKFSRPFCGQRLEIFSPTTIEEVTSLIKEHGLKTSQEDPLPASICKSSLDILIPVLTDLINLSLAEGSIEGAKSSVIDPLLKKAGLDSDVKKNYRPVNKLEFVSKLTERVVHKRLEEHMIINSLHEPSQFGYKKFHSTEHLILSLVNEGILGFDNNLVTLIILLDLSAAFDTLDPDKLLLILKEEIGIDGIALQWFRSFLTGRTQRVKINGKYSESKRIYYGVPQGSVLGPILFGINVRSQRLVFENNKFKTSSFADDANGRKQFALKFQFHALQHGTASVMKEIVKWSNLHYVKINPDKTEMILLRPKHLNKDVIVKGVFIDDECIRFSKEVKNVGVWIDENLNFSKQVNTIVSHGFKILKDIKRTKKYLLKDHLERITHAMVSSRLDYCNSILYGTSSANIKKLQRFQNSTAKMILGKKRSDSSTLALRELHWLKVEARIVFKIMLIVWKSVNGKGPAILDISYKNTRGPNSRELVTHHCKTSVGHRLINYHGTRIWNSLPVSLRLEEKSDIFKKGLKTHLFNSFDNLMKNAFKYTI